MEIEPIKKNEKYIVKIIDNGFNGEGIAKINNFTILVQNAIKNEKCEIIITKVLKTFAYAKIIKIIEPSEYRVNLDCSTYKRCGGCELRHLKYEETLKLKKENVQNLINKNLNTEIKIDSIIGMEKPYNYRNKAQYPIGLNKENIAEIGVFAQRTHTVIQIEKCFIQTEKSQEIAKTIIEFIKKYNIEVYDENKQKGIFRHIIVKTAIKTNQIMCILVLNNREFYKENELKKILIKRYPEITTIVKNINTRNTNVILGNENINIYGNGYIEDILGEYKFKISPTSFYQVNPVQAEILYNQAIQMAELSKKDILFDLYCGIGTIGIFASKYVKKVYGIEIIKEAIIDAKENLKINTIKNVEFILGDVEKVFDKLINKQDIIPNTIIVDPPRKGLDEKTIQNIIKAKPTKVVYISCNPSTLIRDLQKLENIYLIKHIKLVDMFPFTKHVECVCVLKLR